MTRLTIFSPLSEDEPVAIARGLRAAGVPADAHARVVRRSLDARKGRALGFQLEVMVGEISAVPPLPSERVRSGLVVAVVGSGPAGTFAAQALARAGARVTLVERGRPVQPRRHDLALLTRGTLVESSNYCFGEGGAGTFSDGKLYTRVKDRTAVQEVLAALVAHGADPDVQVDSRPHIGSNRLPKILTAMREALVQSGVEYVWDDPVTALLVGERGRVRGLRCASGRELVADAVVLAPGHSARPLYEALFVGEVALAAKGFAIGARIEHPQPLIDRIQYGAAAGHPRLPPSFYQLSAQIEVPGGRRGVYSFCMCPGGWIVPSSTEAGMLCTNGMSLSRRDSPLANAAMVVNVEPADWQSDHPGPLGGIELQREIERRAFMRGGGGYVAAAQRLEDFVGDRPSTRPSSRIARSTYRPSTTPGDVRGALPPLVGEALARGLSRFGRVLPGFGDPEAHLIGVETRSSAPVRILRHERTLSSPSHDGLYPAGEGAGYAGGIVSAAIDGLRVARAIIGRHAR
jgi:uncharacterized FAD-dependent dehydrogenase